MVVTAIVIIVLGVALGLFFPVMFVAAAAGVALLAFALVAAGRRATTDEQPVDPAPDPPE